MKEKNETNQQKTKNCPVTGRLGKNRLISSGSEHINNFKKQNPKRGIFWTLFCGKLKATLGLALGVWTQDRRRFRDYTGAFGYDR